MCVYPAIGLEERKFKHLAKSIFVVHSFCMSSMLTPHLDHWKNINNRRNFFVNFSRVKGFDPLVPTNWYSCSYWELCNSKVIAFQEKENNRVHHAHVSHSKLHPCYLTTRAVLETRCCMSFQGSD